MAEEDKLGLFQELAARGLQDQLSLQDRNLFDEAVRRNLIKLVAPTPDEPISIPEAIIGGGELLVTMGTGMAGQAIGGVAGIIQGVASIVSGDEDPLGAAVERLEQVSGIITLDPSTRGGEAIMETVSPVFEALGEATRLAGTRELEATGSPLAATAMETALSFVPGVLGMRGPRAGSLARRESAAVRKAAKDLGINLNDANPAQRQQVIQAAERATGGRTAVAEGFEEIQSAVQSARVVAKQEVDNLYALARADDAGITIAQTRDFAASAKRALADFDVDTMPIVRRRLAEMDKINTLPENAIVKLNAIANFRKRINRNKPAATDTSQNAALGVLKGQLDSFLDAQFNADMISGNPAALQKWRTANDAFKEFKRTFDDNKTIRQLSTQRATPEEVRRWLFGASTVGAAKQAGDTIKRLKTIVGEDSPSMVAVRQDALFDIMEPLLREDPNFAGFASNYDRFVKNNPTLRKELFPESVADLDKLRDLATAIDRNPAMSFGIDLNTVASRALFGHGIAKAGLKVSLMGRVFGVLRSAVGKSNKQQIMESVLGYDPRAPVIAPLGAVGISETLGRQEGAEAARIPRALPQEATQALPQALPPSAQGLAAPNQLPSGPLPGLGDSLSPQLQQLFPGGVAQ